MKLNISYASGNLLCRKSETRIEEYKNYEYCCSSGTGIEAAPNRGKEISADQGPQDSQEEPVFRKKRPK